MTVWLDDYYQAPLQHSQVEALLLVTAGYRWAIEVEGAFVGTTGLDPLGARLDTARFFIIIGERSLWGRGLGTSVLTDVMDHAFVDLGFRRITSDYFAPNAASRVIHERAGFFEEGCLREDAWRRGAWVDRVLLSRLQSEYFSARRDPASPPRVTPLAGPGNAFGPATSVR